MMVKYMGWVPSQRLFAAGSFRRIDSFLDSLELGHSSYSEGELLALYTWFLKDFIFAFHMVPLVLN